VHSDFWTTRPIGIPPRLLAPWLLAPWLLAHGQLLVHFSHY
jgi:hypothetical protein